MPKIGFESKVDKDFQNEIKISVVFIIVLAFGLSD